MLATEPWWPASPWQPASGPQDRPPPVQALRRFGRPVRGRHPAHPCDRRSALDAIRRGGRRRPLSGSVSRYRTAAAQRRPGRGAARAGGPAAGADAVEGAGILIPGVEEVASGERGQPLESRTGPAEREPLQVCAGAPVGAGAIGDRSGHSDPGTGARTGLPQGRRSLRDSLARPSGLQCPAPVAGNWRRRKSISAAGDAGITFWTESRFNCCRCPKPERESSS